MKGIKAVAKTKAVITDKSFKKGISKKVILNFSKDHNPLTSKFSI